MNLVRPGPGRPMKYGRASRAVTLTLPEDVIARLGHLDTDLGRAIVALTARHTRPRARPLRRAEIANYGNHAVIIVNPAPALKRLAGVELVPIGDGRALIALDRELTVSALELEVRDVLERGPLTTVERETLEAIANILRQARLSRGVTLEQRTIIVLETKRQRRRA